MPGRVAVETLEHLATRLESLHELQSIVRTMKSLATVSIRQYEQAVGSLRAYARTVETGLQVVLRDVPATGIRPREHDNALGCIVFGSDHGLCGRFNEELVEDVEGQLPELAGTSGARWLCVGARPAALLESSGHSVDDVLETPASASRIGITVDQVLVHVDHWQREAGIGRVRLFFQRRELSTHHRPTGQWLLPFDPERVARFNPRRWSGRSRPTYPIEQRRLLTQLVHQYLFVSLFRACAESLATENGSRLAAMQAADSNIGEHLEEVNMQYRRARQEGITTELLDVVSGFEALTGSGR